MRGQATPVDWRAATTTAAVISVVMPAAAGAVGGLAAAGVGVVLVLFFWAGATLSYFRFRHLLTFQRLKLKRMAAAEIKRSSAKTLEPVG